MVDFSSFLPAGLPANPALLPTLLDLLPMGVIYYTPVLDATGTLTDLALAYLNPAAQRMTQLPAQPGTTYRQQFPTTDANGAWDFHRRSWLSREPQQFQFYYDVDGFDSYFRVTAQHLGEGLLAIFTDTQDEVRSQVEQALLASQTRERVAHTAAEAERHRFRDVLMQLPAQVAINRGPDHIFDLVNAPYQQMFPTRPIQGLPVRQALPELEGQQFFELLDHVYQTGEPFYSRAMPAEADFTNSGSRERRYVDVFFQALHDAKGRVDGILNFSYDVTAQVLARQAVEQLNQELETRVAERTQEAERQRQSVVELVEQAPAAMCVVAGPEFRYETFNPLYAAMFGGRPRVGRPMGEVLPEVVNHPSFLAFRAVYEEGRTFRQHEVLVQLARPGDVVLEDRYFDYSQQPRYGSQGQITGVFVFAVEVTEQVLARQQVQDLNQALAVINEELTATNEELNDSNQQLTRTNVDLDTFVYTASHDLKAPITNIESITLALRHALPAEAQQDELVANLLDLLDETTARFQFTIGQLTDLSKLQLAHAGPAEPVRLAAVVAGVRLDLASTIKAAEAQLTVEVAPDLLVSFSPANLRSALYNLLSNAIKYRAPARPCQVAVRATRTGPLVTVQVQDNGLGLNEHQRQRLFGLFQRLHTHVEGTGVGLYITKRLIENGGGTIAVESQVDVGTTFTLTFPA